MNDQPNKLRATDLTPEGQKYFLQKTKGQFILWALVILTLLVGTAILLYFDLR